MATSLVQDVLGLSEFLSLHSRTSTFFFPQSSALRGFPTRIKLYSNKGPAGWKLAVCTSAISQGLNQSESSTIMSNVVDGDSVDPKRSERGSMLELRKYSAPVWAQQLRLVPTAAFTLGRLPTPIHRWNIPGIPEGIELYIKRDDLTGLQLSGNKVRKLEFLLAAAVAEGADCVITPGGIQSNHCRATAVAARYVGLDSHLILRTSRALVSEDPGLVGNLLIERMVGANIHLVSKEEYARRGQEELALALKEQLEKEGKKPIIIPVGGSSPLGTWGYLEAVRELQQQLEAGDAGGADKFDDIVMACGSGGTAAGLSLGVRLSGMPARVHAYGVCDSEDYFYDYIQGLLHGVGATDAARSIIRMRDSKGEGYAISTAEELQIIRDVAEATGIVLDPVYSGKAVKGLLEDMRTDPGSWRGRRVLFLHTGGLFGLYDKLPQLMANFSGLRCRPLVLPS